MVQINIQKKNRTKGFFLLSLLLEWDVIYIR